jgi:sialate O-acetylesterase
MEKENIHPLAKQPVGERLGLLAMDQVYGRDVVSRGPAFHTLEKDGAAVQVVFQYSDPSEAREALPYSQQGSDRRERQKGLQTSDGKTDVPGFEVAGADGEYHPAAAKIVSRDTVELSCADVRRPVSVRYAWHNWVEPPVTLQNSAGLPAEPFSVKLD